MRVVRAILILKWFIIQRTVSKVSSTSTEYHNNHSAPSPLLLPFPISNHLPRSLVFLPVESAFWLSFLFFFLLVKISSSNDFNDTC